MAITNDKIKNNVNITRRGQDYIDGFIKTFNNIDEEYISRKLLSLKEDSQESQYLQGLAEAMLYKFLVKEGFTPRTDVHVNNTAKDVDIVIAKDDIQINFEVKCPTIEEDSKDTLKMCAGHRYSNNKAEHEAIFNPMMDEIKEKITTVPNNPYKKIEKVKLRDNKLKDYLESAQGKFAYPKSNECNVLVIVLTTHDFIDFYDYIVNPQTGLFSEDSFVSPEKFDKVDYIILTNIMAGHYKHKIAVDIWDVKAYLTFLFPNCNKHKGHRKIEPNNSEYTLLRLFGNQLNDFLQFEEEFFREHEDLPWTPILSLTTYLAEKFKVFSQEYKGENLTPLE